ncbi:MAG TPA: mRNA surveillance protein pelota [Candidatus Altiarchaeales archaeon]|nr:mRNA surveillance protein pelota [Candidatus Altiarchaeales archaeon]
MKILFQNRKQGIVKVKIESLDDLWYLSNVIQSGNVIKSKTERRVKGKDDIVRSGKSKRQVVNIAISVERVEFKSDIDVLRISGTIIEGPGDIIPIGSHHTINVEINSELSIRKNKWSRIDLKRLKDAEKASLRPKILITVIDEGEATIGFVRESKIEYFDLTKQIGGKYDTTGRKERKIGFYHDVTKFIQDITQRKKISAVIVAGPGFEKENFHKFLMENYQDLKGRIVIENIGSTGRTGVNEVMKRSKIKEIIEDIESSRDLHIVHKILEEIGKDSGLVAYGPRDVETAVNTSAVDKLLVCDNVFLKDRNKIEGLMNTVKSTSGDIHIVNHESEAGKQLNSLGGIAALLRFRINS